MQKMEEARKAKAVQAAARAAAGTRGRLQNAWDHVLEAALVCLGRGDDVRTVRAAAAAAHACTATTPTLEGLRPSLTGNEHP